MFLNDSGLKVVIHDIGGLFKFNCHANHQVQFSLDLMQ